MSLLHYKLNTVFELNPNLYTYQYKQTYDIQSTPLTIMTFNSYIYSSDLLFMGKRIKNLDASTYDIHMFLTNDQEGCGRF